MKVISGKLKGRNINGFDILGTRPTMDRVKESIFSMIQGYLDKALVLDLFSGSGNLGIEAISNGASKVYFNDNNKKCIKVIRDNLEKFHVLDYSFITNMDFHEALFYYKNKNIKFDLVFLDPPYKDHIINEILDILHNNQLLNNKCLIICETTFKEEYKKDNFRLFKERCYGEKNVLIYEYLKKCEIMSKKVEKILSQI